MSNSPGKYGNVRNFLDNLGNEKIKICRNCNAVFSYTNETTTLCLSCDFEEEISTLPAVVEIEDEFDVTEPAVVDAQPAVLDAQPVTLDAQPVVAEVDVVEMNDDWEMDSFDSIGSEAKTIVEETTEIEAVEAETAEVEPVAEVVEAETADVEPVAEAVEAEPLVKEAVEAIEAETVQDAIESSEIATSVVEEAIEKEEEAKTKVDEAKENKDEASREYSEAVKDEEKAADNVSEAATVQSEAVEAIVEASDKVSELVDSGADQKDIKEAMNELEKTVENKDKAELTLTEAISEEEKAADNLATKSDEKENSEEILENETEELKEASDKLDEAINQKAESEKELSEASSIDTNETDDSVEPFSTGEYVSHGVYGTGKVVGVTKAGKHWSVEVKFEEEQRRILGTFLTKEKKPELQESEYNFKPPVEKSNDEEQDDEVKTYEEHSGKYKPGTEVIHEIFGKGFVRESEPKGENYKLIINFEDGSEKTLLSTFIKLKNEDSIDEGKNEVSDSLVNAEAVEAEPVVEAVEAEPVVEAVEAEPVVEAVEAEPVVEENVNNNDAFKRPTKKTETVIDLSKPEIQDAEMIDDEN